MQGFFVLEVSDLKEDRIKYKAAGLNDFLGKPFTMSQLKELLQQIEDWRREQEDSSKS